MSTSAEDWNVFSEFTSVKFADEKVVSCYLTEVFLLSGYMACNGTVLSKRYVRTYNEAWYFVQPKPGFQGLTREYRKLPAIAVLGFETSIVLIDPPPEYSAWEQRPSVYCPFSSLENVQLDGIRMLSRIVGVLRPSSCVVCHKEKPVPARLPFENWGIKRNGVFLTPQLDLTCACDLVTRMMVSLQDG